ncbi:MAG: energy transducer TonB [Bacteroidaceae bacterium]|nr:energy transducer TonB [Bacteroidaceae bacterium]
MRKLLFTTLLVAVSLSAAAQSQDSITAKAQATNQPSIPPVLAPENMPEFPGGKAEMIKFLSKNIKYPKLAKKYAVGGKVMMTFIIDKNGKPTEISAHDCKIEHFLPGRFAQEPKTVQKELEEKFALQFAKEAARVIRKMPNWIPGSFDGKPVNVKYTLPVSFKLP